MDWQGGIAALEIQKSLTHPNTRSLRLQSPSIDLRTRLVPVLRDVPTHLVSDRVSLQYDVPALKSLALDRINGELSRCNIIEESFSRFASQ